MSGFLGNWRPRTGLRGISGAIALMVLVHSGLPTLAQETTPPPAAPTTPAPDSPPSAVAPPEAEAPAPPPVVTNPPTTYLLGPGDRLQIEVLGYDEFQGDRLILPDGTLTIPLLGSVVAAGKTLPILTAELERRLGEYLVDPVVDASLVTLRPVVVNVVGEVYRPGPVQLSSFTQGNTQLDPAANLTTTTNSPTLHAALIAAGGLKRSADVRQVVIQRPLPNGKTTEFTLNLWDMLTVGDNFNVTLLLDGDSIYVPPLAENNPLDQRFIAGSSLAPATVRVRVIGEVKQPGEVLIPPNSSLSSAIASAGGPTPDAQLDNVLLVRLNELGQVQESSVNLNNLVDNYQVQEGDVVVVAKKGYLSFVDNVYRFLNPVLIPLNLLNLLRVAN